MKKQFGITLSFIIHVDDTEEGRRQVERVLNEFGAQVKELANETGVLRSTVISTQEYSSPEEQYS